MTLVFYSLLMSIFLNIPSFGKINSELYVGVENHIHIHLNNCNPEDIHLKVNIGTLQKRSDSTYIYIPQNPGEEIKFKLYYKKVICAVASSNALLLPEPKLSFEKENNGTIRVKDLSNPGKLQFTYLPFYPEQNKNRILSFALMVNDKNGLPVYSNTVRGDILDENTLKYLCKLSSGAIISVNNIIITNTYKGNTRYMGNLQLLVVD